MGSRHEVFDLEPSFKTGGETLGRLRKEAGGSMKSNRHTSCIRRSGTFCAKRKLNGRGRVS